MAVFGERNASLEHAERRAMTIAAGVQGKPVMGTAISQLILHGGIYSLADPEMMKRRMAPLVAAHIAQAAGGRRRDGDPEKGEVKVALASAQADAADMMQKAVEGAAAVPTFYFYHLVNHPYRLGSDLVSFLIYPARHLRSPIVDPPPAPPDPESMKPHGPTGKTYSHFNVSSKDIPAAFTFVGQFIDHDLTLNAVNLFDPQMGLVQDLASPLIDLDSVYGPRIDDTNPEKYREVPMKDGFFCLNPVPDSDGYDVCRTPMPPACPPVAAKPDRECPDPPEKIAPIKQVARIGDKRNDENQIILQVHILLMRLHNAFRKKFENFCVAKRQTIYHWQSFVANSYLMRVAEPKLVCEVRKRLLANTGCKVSQNKKEMLFHRPTYDSRGRPVLSMPHEFAIGFRFGHSQLRSEYQLHKHGEIYRLFDSLSLGTEDLQGGKFLDAGRLIDWCFFADVHGQDPITRSNKIDTNCNEVIYDLLESTIPDEIRLVSNLAKRNLIRSDSLGLCSGEDLAGCYAEYYPGLVAPLSPDQVEPDRCKRPLFERDCGTFRTPLWYYILREAEVADTGRLGPLGSLLVAEVILSGIYYAEHSFLREPGWRPEFGSGCPDEPCEGEKGRCITLCDIAEYVKDTGVEPPSCNDCDTKVICCHGDKEVDCSKAKQHCWGGLATP